MADYTMRAWQTVTLEYVSWFSAGQPDWTGAFSGQPPAELADIIVLRFVPTSGVEPGQGGGSWEYPPMDVDVYAPADVAIDATDIPDPPAPGLFYENFMTEGAGLAVLSMATLNHYNLGDLTDLMAEHP